MSIDTEKTVLTNDVSKFETLLYQFIKLYDRLTVEHSLMTDRELKLLKRLEKLNELIERLNEFIPEVTKIIQDTNQQSVKKSWDLLSELTRTAIKEHLDRHLNYCCNKLHNATDNIGDLINEYGKVSIRFLAALIGLSILIGMVAGMIIGRYIF